MSSSIPLNVPQPLNGVFVPFPDVHHGSGATGTSDVMYTFSDFEKMRAQVLCCAEKHYREHFEESLRHDLRWMQIQEANNIELNRLLSEYRGKFFSAEEKLNHSQFVIGDLHRQIHSLASKNQTVLESHKSVSQQLAGFQQAENDGLLLLNKISETLARLCITVDISNSISSVQGSRIAQMDDASFPTQEQDVIVLSPRVVSRATSPVNQVPLSPEDSDVGVPVAVDADAAPANGLSSEIQAESGEIVVLKQQIEALTLERDGCNAELSLSRTDVHCWMEVVKGLKSELEMLGNDNSKAVDEQTRVCLELSGLRTEHAELQWKLRVAETGCERMRDEKELAIKANKHFEETNKKIRRRAKTLHEDVKGEVLAVMKHELEDMKGQFHTNAEAICSGAVFLAQKANDARDRLYESTSTTYTDMWNELRAMRELVSAPPGEGVFKHEPPALTKALALLNKQYKAVLEENMLQLAQLRTLDKFIHCTDKSHLYARHVELESKIGRLARSENKLRDQLDDKTREALRLTTELVSMECEVVRLNNINQETESRLGEVQRLFLHCSDGFVCDLDR